MVDCINVCIVYFEGDMILMEFEMWCMFFIKILESIFIELCCEWLEKLGGVFFVFDVFFFFWDNFD